jgi:hypothetical protein
MNHRDRLHQLHGLLDRLERMPASADRDWMLAEVRGRAVDVETGMAPSPLRVLPQDELGAERAARTPPPPPAPSKPRPSAPARPAPAPRRERPVHVTARVQPGPVRVPEHEDVVDLLAQDGVMSLDDPPSAVAGASRPWSRGLRG